MPPNRPRRRGAATSDDMERCRLWGHSWYPYDAELARGGWREVLLCERCTTKRATLIDRNGFVHSRAYDYADGYRDASHTGYETKDERRAAYYASELRAVMADEVAAKRTKKHAG